MLNIEHSNFNIQGSGRRRRHSCERQHACVERDAGGAAGRAGRGARRRHGRGHGRAGAHGARELRSGDGRRRGAGGARQRGRRPHAGRQAQVLHQVHHGDGRHDGGREVDIEAVLALLPPELAEHNAPSLRACGTVRGADHCDTAFRTQQCWQNANKADYFLI
nr:LOW QUALITY PROTEIN: uncharacterized protein LOC110380784 [Helicoverpa armigera]